MEENMDDSMQLEGEIDFSAPTPPHEAASADMFGSPAPDVEHDTFPQSPAPSIDFSVATVDSPKNRPLPSLDGDNEHDQFDFDDSLDLFSVEGKKHELLSDMSEDEGKKSKERKHRKERKEKKHRKRESAPKETEEKVVKSTVSEEIEVVKKLESGPTKAELARRSLIELDEDEMEERVERRNRAALEVISKATGLTRLERRQKIIECRTYLKPFVLANGDLAEFLESAIDKHNNRIYLNQDPLVKVVAYLKKSVYSDDESDAEKEEEGKEEGEDEAMKAQTSSAPAVHAASEEIKSSFIELSDSEAEDEEEEEELEVAPAPVAPAAPVVSAAELAAQQRALQIERLRAAAEEKERAELERRRLRFEAAQKVQRSSRTELLTSLRQKVTVAAKENYCSQSKVKAEDLPERLKITDTSRLLVELLKEQQEERNQTAREKRRAKFQNVANDDEEEFDSEAEEEALEEGKYLTAAERAALLQGDDDEEEDQSSIEDDGDMDVDMEVDGEGELAPVDEERQGLREVMDREETVLEVVSDDSEGDSDGDNEDEEGEGSSQVDTQVDTQMDTQLDTQGPTQGPGSDGEEEDEEVRVQRSKRSSRPSQAATQGAASPVVQSGGVKTKYGRVRLGVEPSEVEQEEDDLLLLDEQDQAQTGPTQLETQLTSGDEDASVRADTAADDVSLIGETVATKSKAKKSRSTGNALYRLALEEEERRHRTRKGNNLMDDEAAEEEEEGMQAGLGDFGFGVTSNIREHDEEMNALKVRKGDFDNIVDDLSDDEGDEAAGAAARAEMELLEDRARDRAIITAVTEGHDAMRSRAKKGAFSFDKLVGDNALLADKRRRKQGEEGGAEGAPEEEEEFDEEELMQRGMQNRTDRERLSRARRGHNAGDSDYDSDSSAPSDGEDDMFELLDTSGMTEEEKVAEMERVQRLREKNRQDALMAKQRIQSYKMARERARQEKIRRQQLEQSQSQSQGLYHTSSTSSSSNLPGLSRQGSMGGTPRMARSLTLQPLEDEYSRILMLQRAESVSQPQLATTASSSSSSGVGSGSNLMPPPTISPRGVAISAGVDGKLADITNVPQQQIKRRTTLVPKQAVGNDKRTMRRTQSSVPSSAAPGATATGPQSNLYKGELNKKDVQEGYGMGMAVKAQKVDISGGIFSAVTGIRRIGDLAATKPHSFTTLKKRTFSEAGKLGSTVAAQQFVFGAADEGSRMDSNSGFGSRSASVQGAQGVKRPAGSAFQIPGGSLFAQLGAKRGRT